MFRLFWIPGAVMMVSAALLLLSGCGSVGSAPPAAAVTITSHGANAVTVWDEIATNTINLPAAATGTVSEKQPNYFADLTTLHIAIYDAVIAIAGTHKPYAITPTTPGTGASMEAAADAAAYGVLKGLYPARASVYQATYDSRLAAIAEGDAKARGLALGAEVARGILALRANDGRDTALVAYVPGTAPGKFRGVNPINRSFVYIKPFAMTGASQFRVEGPPALNSSAYAADFNETKAFGSASSTLRNATQTEAARFHTEPPPRFWPRNFRRFASSNESLTDNARLMAAIWVAHADATIACFESKYHFEFWRPTSAIALAADGDNAASTADAAWTPVVATPNHPEYPAAHGCVAGAAAEVLSNFFHTRQVSFQFDSTVPGTAIHTYETTDAFVSEIQSARIHGGIHFRTSTAQGAAQGEKVARWVGEHFFAARN